MDQTISLFSIFGPSLSTRDKAVCLIDIVDIHASRVILDFEQITFMSRSFADELYNVIESIKSEVIYINCTSVVMTMMSAVSMGRKKQRRYEPDNASMLKFDDIQNLSLFLEGMSK